MKEKKDLIWKVTAIAAICLLLIVSVLYGIELSRKAKNGAGGVKESLGAAANASGAAGASLSRDGYTLEQVVCLSRHNIRSPLKAPGSPLATITPHEWFDWTSGPSELSLRGGALEAEMGGYFRRWLEAEGLFEENFRPDGDEIRIYANSKQRTIATARYFASGLLPVGDVEIEYHEEFDEMDPVFTPQLTYASESYAADADAEQHELFDSSLKEMADNYELLAEVIDLKDSESFKNGDVTGFFTDDSVFTHEEGKEPGVSGSLKTACQVSDALVLQYYENPDAKEAAFGHELSEKDWESIAEIKDLYGDVLFTSPLIAVNVAHPLLEEMRDELWDEDRLFCFLCGHDSNVGSVLAALEAEDYSLPYAIEKKTPIGCKLVICRWTGPDGDERISLDLVYQTTEQLKGLDLLDVTNPPAVYSLRLKGLTADEYGTYDADEVLERFEKALDAFDDIIEEYELSDAA
ncbi:MAG: histidine-type phosphatase [Lachnospiraceae bacterium]|nr:histidine-type phosphatase [Lachnospiraceae bacterium]